MNPLTARSESLPRLWPRLAMVNVAIVLAWFAPPQSVLAVDPPPDGGYPNGNTAEGDQALFNLMPTYFGNTAIGDQALYSSTAAGQLGSERTLT
jgi:hypothetical protein